MRALEHGVFWKREGVVCTIYKYIHVCLFVTSLSTDREKGFDFSFFLFFFFLFGGGGQGVQGYMPFVLICFFCLVYLHYKCLKKVQTKSELPSQDCVLLTVGVLKLLTTRSHRCKLDFLCSLTFFPLDSPSLLYSSHTPSSVNTSGGTQLTCCTYECYVKDSTVLSLTQM